MIAVLIFMGVDAYLSISLLGAFHTDLKIAYYSLFATLQLLIASQLWLYFIFFKSKADDKIAFEKPIQKIAFHSMGMISFLVVLTLFRDAMAVILFAFEKSSVLYGVIPSASLILLSVVCVLAGYVNARFKVVSPRVEISVLTDSTLSGLCIIQLSDMHLGTGPNASHVAVMVDRALSLNADLIVLTGDIIDGLTQDLQSELDELARLKAPYGVYFVLGNHECYWRWRESVEAMKKIGIIPLLNEGREIKIRNESIFIAGMNDPAITQDGGEGPKIPIPPAHSKLNIALMHQPQFAESVANVLPAYHLQLSGHTHGGQFFPWTLIVDRMYPIARGLGKIKKLWVYVNQGTGYWGPPIRLGTHAEVTCLIINKETSK